MVRVTVDDGGEVWDVESLLEFLDEDDEEVAQEILFRRVIARFGDHPPADDLEIQALTALTNALAEAQFQIDTIADAVDDLEAENKRLRQRLDGRDSQRTSKEQKVADIVAAARSLREDADVVQLTARDIVSATNVSRRYAYDLMDALPEEYDWILAKEDIRQYGDLEIKKADDTRRIGIDFEGVHSTGVPVNKFTTSIGREDAQR